MHSARSLFGGGLKARGHVNIADEVFDVMSSPHLQKRAKVEKSVNVAHRIVVATRASKKIPKEALVWALTHVVRPGSSVMLLVVVPCSTGRRFWGIRRFSGDYSDDAHRKCQSGGTADQRPDIPNPYSRMMLQLKDVYDSNEINIKIVSGSPHGAVAAECRRIQASWVVFDRHLQREEKRCIEELQCNLVVMKRSKAKFLRLNLVGDHEADTQIPCIGDQSVHAAPKLPKDLQHSIRMQTVASSSSTELEELFTATDGRASSLSSSNSGPSTFSSYETDNFKKSEQICTKDIHSLEVTSTDSDEESISPSRTDFQPWMPKLLGDGCSISMEIEEVSKGLDAKVHICKAKAMLEKHAKLDREIGICPLSYAPNLSFTGNVREAISLARNAPPGPPPLCSVCLHKTPVFGKPPKWFNYSELELATGGFSQANFLAEGGFGSVHRGVLPDGQAIAVKQHKLASSQGDQEFCSEVDVLSCAQHRNVVMLIGFCIEESRRLLVYEYICNGSLDSHLYGCNKKPLEWPARQKIAVGAARGLRYLHEECRVGCIVHRDMRPNNILLTHDFEPLVGDFGLARWQADGDLGVETRVIGTFGYLAPEYAQSGQITEKADVYSFGVVLLELVTGRKAVDVNGSRGQQFLTQWARPLLQQRSIRQLIDPRLGSRYSEQEVRCMMHAALLCIRPDPQARPRMSQVLRMLEGDTVMKLDYNMPQLQDGKVEAEARADGLSRISH